MSISEAESGLTGQQYTDIQAAYGDLAVDVVLQRYGPVWTTHDTEGARSGDNFDAAVAGAYLLRVYTGTLSDLEVERLADESGGDESWATVATGTHSDIDVEVPPSLVTNGLTARVFHYTTGGQIKYIECADISSGTFGAAQTVGAVANVIFLAAVSTTKVYYITKNANHNRVLHVYEDTGSWVNTDSDIYWPYSIKAFDAVTFETGRDLLTLATDLPPLIGSRVIGAEVAQEVNMVQGIVSFWVANGRWSDHSKADVIDRIDTDPSRSCLRQTLNNSLLFTTYLRSGGTEAYPYSKAAVARSADGQNWEFPELIESLTPPYAILARSDYLYAVGVDKVLRSPCCAWAGQTPVEYDLTEYVLGLESTAADIRSSQVTVSNPADALAATLAKSDDRIQARYKIGYVVGGTSLLMQVSLEDVVERAEQAALPKLGLALTTRDFLGRVNRVRSDYAAEWPNMQAGRDIYNDPSGTGYGGLRHTAPYEGSWKTPGDDEIHLLSKNREGLAISTLVADALNGSAQTAFQLMTTGEGEYAGIAFRTFDKDNLHYLMYDLDADVINLVKGVGTDDNDDDERDNTVLDTSVSMSWVEDTWYYLKVVVRYSLVYAYYSTNGVDWTAVNWTGAGAGAVELDGVPDITAFSTWPTLSGKFGLIGYGYSDVDTWPPYDPPPWVPPIPLYGLKRVIILTSQGVFYTETFDEASPVWLACNNNLSAAERTSMRQISFDFADGNRLFMVNSYGAYRCPKVWDSQAWDLRFDNDYAITAINAAGGPCTPEPVADGYWACVNCDPTDSHLEFIAGRQVGAPVGCHKHKRAFYSGDSLNTVTVGDGLWHEDGDHASTPWAGCISRESGLSLYTYVCGWALGSDAHRGYSSDGGITVTTSAPGADGQLAAWSGARPYHTRVGSTVVFFLHGSTRLCFSGDGGVTFTKQDGILPAGPMDTKGAMSLHRHDTSKMMYVSSGRALRRSSDGGYTWGTCPTAPSNPYCTSWAATAGVAAGDGFIVGCWKTAGLVRWTTNFGETWVDKTGDLDTYLDIASDHVYYIIPVGA